jgi:glycosyltransferase involved in cell wall biosynthesis
MSALVKVIVPCYRYGDLLEDCLAGITSQEGVDVRVLVVDDCSPDDTAAVATRLAAADPRIEFRRHEQNVGLIGTANEGLEWAADSDYVVLLSADDFLTPGCLARAVGVMERNPGVGLVYGRPQFFEPGHGSVPPQPESAKSRGATVWSGKRWIERRCRTAHNCIASPEAVVRTSVQRRVGGYDPACYHTSDLNMWLRIAAVSDVGYVRGAVQAMYRIHADSMLRSDADPMVDLRERRNGFERFFADAGRAIDGRAGMERTVRRTLARQALWQASRAYDRGETDGPGAAPIAELVEFALETCPEARHLREWAGLRLRRKIGAGRSLLFVPFLATGAGHRVRSRLGQLRWRFSGV